ARRRQPADRGHGEPDPSTCQGGTATVVAVLRVQEVGTGHLEVGDAAAQELPQQVLVQPQSRGAGPEREAGTTHETRIQVPARSSWRAHPGSSEPDHSSTRSSTGKGSGPARSTGVATTVTDPAAHPTESTELVRTREPSSARRRVPSSSGARSSPPSSSSR